LEAHRGLVACPNCTNVGLVVVLHALATVLNVSRATVTSMQAASGGGRSMLEGLQEGRAEGADCLAGNLLPLCDVLLDDGRSAEERRLQVESTRLLGAAMPPLDATCVRVPVEVGHALSLTLHCEEDVSLAAVREGLSLHPDIHVAAEASIQTPKRVRGKEGVFVGRVRVGGNARTVQMWIVIDNLLTGAASNAVRIAEKLLP
jgi:aspartate-semialdehyde dehydrogenase